MKDLKLYVLLRKDLNPSYQAVQGGHAVAELLLRGPTLSWDNGTMVYLGVKDEDELKYWAEKLEFKDIDFAGFIEPDLNNEMTALATVHTGEVFSNLKLL